MNKVDTLDVDQILYFENKLPIPFKRPVDY